jgi:hypothetical protein
MLLNHFSLQAAVVVVPVTQAFTHNANGATPLVAAYNNDTLVKINPDDVSTWLHGTTTSSWTKTWQADGASSNLSNWGKVGWIIFDLGSIQTELEMMYLWNVTENNTTAQTQRGTKDFKIWYATTPGNLPASNVVNANYTFGEGWTQLGTTQTLNIAPATATGGQFTYDGAFDLSGIGSARYIAIEILTNWGSGTGGSDSVNRVGLAEVVFTAAPEPSKVLLLLTGLFSLGLRRRR